MLATILTFVLGATSDGADAGKAIALGVGGGLGAVGAGVGIGIIFGKVIESVTRQPEMRDEITGIQWLGFALTEACFFYGLVAGLIAFFLQAEMLPNLTTVIAASSGGGSFLVSPNVGLMIWTLIVFGISLYILGKFAFPRIAEALEKRQRMIEDSIDAADRTRREAERLLAEYRERLSEARGQADEIVTRARRTGEAAEAEIVAEARTKREEMMEQTRREIEAETRRAIQQIRVEVADLTVAATEKVTRKTLDSEDQKRLVEEALSELDFATLSGEEHRQLMEEIAQVYARSLFEVASEHNKLDEIKEQLDEFADALEAAHDLQVFFFSPYFSTKEKEEGLDKAVTGADEVFVNFLKLLLEKHRMPVIFRVRRDYDAMWEEENRLLPVSVTSAVELDKQTVGEIGDRIAEQTGRKVELSAHIDPDLLGGIVVRVGNQVLDASVRNRLEQLRKQVARAA